LNYPENGKIFDIFVLITYIVARLNYIIKTKTVLFLINNYENNEKNAGEHTLLNTNFFGAP